MSLRPDESKSALYTHWGSSSFNLVCCLLCHFDIICARTWGERDFYCPLASFYWTSFALKRAGTDTAFLINIYFCRFRLYWIGVSWLAFTLFINWQLVCISCPVFIWRWDLSTCTSRISFHLIKRETGNQLKCLFK